MSKIWPVWIAFVVASVSFAFCQLEGPLKPQPDARHAGSQSSTNTDPQKPKPDWRVNWRNATVAFGTVKRDSLSNRDYFSAGGTGVIISTGENSAYVVTAKHVFCDPEKRWYPSELNVRFAWQDRKSIHSFTGIPFPLRNDKGVPLWFALDDGSDIAVLPVPQDFNFRLPEDDRREQYDVIGPNNIDSDVYEGEQVLVFGFPGVAGNDYLARIVVRQGIVAWTNPNSPAESIFLVDANLYPGNSGGPVIRWPFGLMKDGSTNYLRGGELTLLGIVSQGIQQDIKSTISGPRVGQVEAHTQIAGIGAIGIIEPASKVSKLLRMIQEQQTKTPVCAVEERKAEKQTPR